MQSASQSPAQSSQPKPAKPWQFRPGQSGLPQGRYALMKERARLEEEERQVEVAGLLADLGHPATGAEKLLIDEAAACVVEARKLRRQGKSTVELTRMLDRIVGRLGLGRPAEAPGVDVSTMLGSQAMSKAEVARKRAAKAECQVEAADREGGELAVDVRRQCMVAFRDVAEAFRPGTRRKPNKGANLGEFEKWSRLVLRACELLAPFETPKALVASPPGAIEATTVTVNTEVNLDLSTLTDEQLIARYRSRIAGGTIAVDPEHFRAAALASPQPEPSLPAAVVTAAPVEVEEPAEKLQLIVGEPEPSAAGERTAAPVQPANVIPLITPEIVARAVAPRSSVEEYAKSIGASQAGNQSGPHTGNPMAGVSGSESESRGGAEGDGQ